MRNTLRTLAGFLLLSIGGIGALVPILPTTPFVILASVCFAGNPRARAWLQKSKFFREHAANYRERTGLAKRTVVVSIAFLWGTLLTSMLATGKAWAVLLLTGVGIAVTTHILWIARPKPSHERPAALLMPEVRDSHVDELLGRGLSAVHGDECGHSAP